MGLVVEDKVLAFLLSSKKNCEYLMNMGVMPSWFSDQYSRIIAQIYIESCYRHKTLPSKEQFLRELRKVSNGDEGVYEAVVKQQIELSIRAENDDLSDIDYWVGELRKAKTASDLKDSISRALDTVDSDQHDGLNKALYNLLDDLHKITVTASSSNLKTYSVNDPEFLQARLDHYAKVKSDPDRYGGIKTGLSEFDSLVGGIRPGELFVFIGRHASGKSAILNTIAHNAFIAGKNVMFAGLEMSQEQNAMRFDSRYALVSMKRLRNGCLTPEEEERYQEALEMMQYFKNKLYIIPDVKCQTIQDIQRELTYCQEVDGVKIDLLVIDYLNILGSYTIQRNSSMPVYQQQKVLAEECRNLGKMYNLGVVTAGQANRQGVEKNTSARTEVAALSDFIGATADVMVRLIRGEEEQQANILTADVIKNRNGESRKITLACNLDKMFIGDITDPVMTQTLSEEGDYEFQPQET
jgi:replicative DNA helicase